MDDNITVAMIEVVAETRQQTTILPPAYQDAVTMATDNTVMVSQTPQPPTYQEVVRLSSASDVANINNSNLSLLTGQPVLEPPPAYQAHDDSDHVECCRACSCHTITNALTYLVCLFIFIGIPAILYETTGRRSNDSNNSNDQQCVMSNVSFNLHYLCQTNCNSCNWQINTSAADCYSYNHLNNTIFGSYSQSLQLLVANQALADQQFSTVCNVNNCCTVIPCNCHCLTVANSSDCNYSCKLAATVNYNNDNNSYHQAITLTNIIDSTNYHNGKLYHC